MKKPKHPASNLGHYLHQPNKQRASQEAIQGKLAPSAAKGSHAGMAKQKPHNGGKRTPD